MNQMPAPPAPPGPSAHPAADGASLSAPWAELLTIGSELLLGETVDSNAAHLARLLGSVGIPVRRKVSVGDDVAVIGAEVAAALERAPLLVTTGGLGPTQDDPTREAVALATARPLEFRPELWEQVRARFRAFGRLPSSNNRQQAFVPAGAIALENLVGTAPAFIVDLGHAAVVCLPGVPREMDVLMARAVLPWLRQRFGLTAARCLRVLHTVGAGESQIDERIRDLEALQAPTVGLAAHAGQVDLRITAWAATAEAAQAQVAPVEAELRARLGHWIFGSDSQTLAGVVLDALAARGLRLAVLEAGLGGALAAEAMSGAAANGPGDAGPAVSGPMLVEARALPVPLDSAALATAADALALSLEVPALIAASVLSDPSGPRRLLAYVRLPEGVWHAEYRHGGPPAHAPRRAALAALALARAALLGLADPSERGS